MRIAIAGAHGQIARRLTKLLTQDGEEVVGLIRKEEQAEDIRADGGEPALVDLEQDTVEQVAEAIAGCDAAVFAAGSGPGSGEARKWSMDRDGAVLLMRACEQAGVERYVMISSMGAGDPPEGDEGFAVYLQAKAAADEALRESDLRWTIVRPGKLTDEDGSGKVEAGESIGKGEIPRDDVAASLAVILREDPAPNRVVELLAGDRPVEQALAG